MWAYLLMPIVTAGIGWVTNWVAIKMLFLPLEPMTIFPGVRIQGLIPRRQKDLARQVAEIIEKELISQHMIRDAVQSAGIGDLVEARVRSLIREKLVSRFRAIPFLGAMINDEVISGIEDHAVRELRGMSESLAVEFADRVEGRLQVRQLVQERIESFDLLKLKQIVESVASKEFRTIEITGAILGGLIGVFQSLYFILIQGDLA